MVYSLAGGWHKLTININRLAKLASPGTGSLSFSEKHTSSHKKRFVLLVRITFVRNCQILLLLTRTTAQRRLTPQLTAQLTPSISCIYQAHAQHQLARPNKSTIIITSKIKYRAQLTPSDIQREPTNN